MDYVFMFQACHGDENAGNINLIRKPHYTTKYVFTKNYMNDTVATYSNSLFIVPFNYKSYINFENIFRLIVKRKNV